MHCCEDLAVFNGLVVLCDLLTTVVSIKVSFSTLKVTETACTGM